jgi:hypothetical protein
VVALTSLWLSANQQKRRNCKEVDGLLKSRQKAATDGFFQFAKAVIIWSF